MNIWTKSAIIVLVASLAACASHQARVPAASAPAAKPASTAAAPKSPDTAPAAAKTSAKTAKTHRLWGIVQSVDATNNKLSLKSSTGIVHELTLASGASITKGGENNKIALSDVKEGDKVTTHLDGTIAMDLHVNVTAP